jgi:hypothetical protein
MMNENQYLLIKLAEECAEVAQRAIKQVQFGKNEIEPGQNLTNGRRLLLELNDLQSLVEILEDEDEIPTQSYMDWKLARQEKRDKIDKYKQYSRKLGLLW